jgi:hypothetical protein
MRQWRVGTISMGILLITIGVLLIFQRVNGISSVAFILRWWPIVLILIGIEVLTYAYFSKQDSPKIKYDGLSIFIVIILIIFSVGAYTLSSIPFGNVHNTFFNGFPGIYKNDSSFTKKMTIDPKTMVRLNASNAYGNIDIEKSEDKNIEVEAEIRMKNNDEAYAKKVSEKLIEIKQEDEISIISRAKDYMNDSTKLQNINVNLKIKVPSGMEVSIVNEYGDITAADITKSLTVKNKNGQIKIESVGGTLMVDNQYGNIDASKIKGICEIKDKNGQIRISDVAEDLKVDNEYGNISVENVNGNVDLNDRNADISVTDASGNVTIDSAYSGMKLSDIKGSLNLKGKNANMDIENVGEGIKAINEYGQVTIVGAHKAIDIEDRNGNVELDSDKIFEDNINIQNEYGNITINFPGNQNAYVKAITSYGEINNDFKLNVESQENDRTIDSQLGSNGIKINLKTRNGNIDIK